jgi:hypothetical protein
MIMGNTAKSFLFRVLFNYALSGTQFVQSKKKVEWLWFSKESEGSFL